jgi:hypothetical protein
VFVGHLIGLAALGLARAADHVHAALLSVALRAAARVGGTGASWAQGIALFLRAGVEALRQQPALVLELMEASIQSLEASGMPLYAAGARYRLGEFRGDERGREEKLRAISWLKTNGAVAPERLVAILAPQL